MFVQLLMPIAFQLPFYVQLAIIIPIAFALKRGPFKTKLAMMTLHSVKCRSVECRGTRKLVLIVSSLIFGVVLS